MQLALSWDLLIVIFFGVIITYSFIIGKHESVKIIIATYIAILTVQGAGNILHRILGESAPLMNALGLSPSSSLLSGTKLLLFVAIIVFLSIRGGFEVQYLREGRGLRDTLLTGAFGFATAGLILSTFLTFIAGGPLLSSTLRESTSLSALLPQSELLSLLVLNQDLWFSFPAFLLLGTSFLHLVEK